MELDKSWYVRGAQPEVKNLLSSDSFIIGVYNFRDKAIKDLQAVVDNNDNPYIEGIKMAIIVLKDLKAE